MRTTNHLWLILGILTLSPALAGQGNENSGGGNAKSSTTEQVLNALGKGPYADPSAPIALARDFLVDARNRLSPGFTVPIQDSKIAPMLRKVLALQALIWDRPERKFAAVLDFSGIRIDARITGACIEGGEERDASISKSKDEIGSAIEICMSVERLKRFAPDSLREQVGALFLHELAHAAGYGEEDAIALQEYALKHFESVCNIQLLVTRKLEDGQKSLNIVSIEDGMRTFGSKVEASSTLRQTDAGGNVQRRALVSVLTWQQKDEFQLNWSPSGSGSLKFVNMNNDGSLSKQSFSWEKVTPVGSSGNPERITAFQVLGSDVRGHFQSSEHELEVKSIALTGECAR